MEYEMISAFDDAASKLKGLQLCIALSDSWLQDLNRCHLFAVNLYESLLAGPFKQQEYRLVSSEFKIYTLKFHTINTSK